MNTVVKVIYQGIVSSYYHLNIDQKSYYMISHLNELSPLHLLHINKSGSNHFISLYFINILLKKLMI